MNSLSYAILGILLRTPMSGYELGKRLELLWTANLSQIYPTLGKLEKLEYVRFEVIEQIGKPNKKEFYITDKGIANLKEWVLEDPSDPIIRDEFVVKFYSTWLSDVSATIKLLKDRLQIFTARQEYFISELARIEKDSNIDQTDKYNRHFSQYLLIKRRVDTLQSEIDWCKETINLL